MSAVDLYTTYQFIKRLVTPFEKWRAFNLGIIDGEGRQLRTRSEFKNESEHSAFGYLDLLALNLKKILAKVPGGNKTFGTYAAALLLMREYPKVQREEAALIDELPELMEGYLAEAALLDEDAPTNSGVGGPAIATSGNTPLGLRDPKRKGYKAGNELDTIAMQKNLASIMLKRNAPQ